MKTKDFIILGLVIAIGLLFIFNRKEVVVIENGDTITRLETRHIWDSIGHAEYVAINQPIIDSAKYYKKLAGERGERIISLEYAQKQEQEKIDTSNVEDLSSYLDGYVGSKEGATVKEIDSSQLRNAVKLLSEGESYRDIAAELTDENNYLTMMSAKYEEAYDYCQEEVVALNDTLVNRGIENEDYVIDSTKECNKQLKKKDRQMLWTRIGSAFVVTGVVVLALLASGA